MFRSVSWLFLAVILCLGCSMGANRILKLTNQGEIQFLEQSGNGTNKLSLKASDAMSGDVTLKLPDADGSNGQFLKTNGSGQLSFANGTSTLQSAYDAGATITSSGVTIQITGGNATVFKVTQANNAGPNIKLENTGTNACLTIDASGGSGHQINGNAFLVYNAGEVACKTYTTGGRPAATGYNAGTMIFNTTTGIPNWSDGTNWKDAAGNTV